MTIRRGPSARRMTVAVVTVAGATAVSVVMAWSIATGPPIRRAGWTLLWQLAVWSAAWGIAVAAVWLLPRRLTVPVVVAAVVLVRVGAMAGQPITSDDLYRYSWDGRVQAAGIDPYRYPPAANELRAVREEWLWPTVQRCAAIGRQPGCTLINRSTEPTIYPPAAEAWFAVVYRVAGIESRHKAWQTAGFIVELGTIVLLLVALRRWRRDERWAALYALSPIPALELVNNGHVDGVAVALVLAAIIVARPPPGSTRIVRSTAARDALVGLLIGAAVLVKLYPALLLVALLATRRDHPWRRTLRSAVAATAVLAIAYLPHALAVGAKVLGYLPGYLDEEDYVNGGRFLLAQAVGLDGTLAAAASLLVLLAVIAALVVRHSALPIAAVTVFGTLLLVTSPVQPWYSVSLLVLAALAGRPRWVAVSLAGYPYFLAVILGSAHAIGIGQAAYGAAAAAVVVAALAAGHPGTTNGAGAPRPALLPAAIAARDRGDPCPT